MRRKLMMLIVATTFVVSGCTMGPNNQAPISSLENVDSNEGASTDTSESGDSKTGDSSDVSDSASSDVSYAGSVDYTEQIIAEVAEIVANSESLSDELVEVNTLFLKYEGLKAEAQDQTEMNYLSQWGTLVWETEVESLLERTKEKSSTPDDLASEHENWSKYVDTMAERMSVTYKEGTIYPVMLQYNKAMRYREEAFTLASTLADLNGEVTFSFPEHDACGYYGDYAGDDYLIINEGMESGSYEIIIHISGKDEIHGFAYVDESEDNYSEDLNFTSDDDSITGIVSHFALGASLSVTESDGSILQQGETYEFTFKY